MSKIYAVGSLPEQKDCPECLKHAMPWHSGDVRPECDAHLRERVRIEDEREQRYLSAAPEMLEALRAAEAELEQHTAVPGVADHVLPAIRAAIAKAEGRL